MADTQTYSYLEIQRYLQQKMSPQEMHEFEKALMNDPFLADALEGFSASDTSLAEEHLASIERSLTAEKQEAKVVPLPVQKTAWWKVAAIILVIVSAGAITYAVINNQGTSNNKNEITATAPKAITPQKDSVGPVEKPLAQLEVMPQKKLQQKNTSPLIRTDAIHPSELRKLSIEEPNVRYDTSKENASLMAAAASAPAIANDAVVSQKRLMLTNATAQNEFKGKVVDKTGEPLPYADIKAADNRLATIVDAKGNFTLKAPDSVLQVNVNSPGYASAETKIKSNDAENKITLKESEMSLADIVVTGMGKKKKNYPATVQIDSSIAAEPVGGWTNFKQYIHQQLDSLKANDNDFNEDIALEFSIDKQGHPVDIKAPAEIDKMMAEKAIKILSNGPRWRNTKKDKKVKVIIAF